MVWKATEWESESGWHCNCTDALSKGSGVWYMPARILSISPADFISLLVEKFKPDHFYYNKETGFCNWSWDSQAKMRLYKNWINAEARKKNFQI